MRYRRWFLVHNGMLVWTRSSNRPAIYESLTEARKWTAYHTTDYERHPDGTYHLLPEVHARILEFTIEDDVPSVKWVPREL
jgi:hypothetical protein